MLDEVVAHTPREHKKSEAKHLDGNIGLIESP